jgi:hypothetical protein
MTVHKYIQAKSNTGKPQTGLPQSPDFNRLVGQLGDGTATPDLGFWRNLAVSRKTSEELAQGWTAVQVKKVQTATVLAIEQIDSNVALIRADWERDFAERYGAISMRAAAARINVKTDLEALLLASRRFVFTEMNNELEALKAMLDKGVITEEMMKEEATFVFERYTALKNQFATLCDEYANQADGAFRK